MALPNPDPANDDDAWYLDTNSNSSIAKRIESLDKVYPVTTRKAILVGHGERFFPQEIGCVRLSGRGGSFNVQNVLLKPDAKHNLISVRSIVRSGLTCTFGQGGCLIIGTHDFKQRATATGLNNGMYRLNAVRAHSGTSDWRLGQARCKEADAGQLIQQDVLNVKQELPMESAEEPRSNKQLKRSFQVAAATAKEEEKRPLEPLPVTPPQKKSKSHEPTRMLTRLQYRVRPITPRC